MILITLFVLQLHTLPSIDLSFVKEPIHKFEIISNTKFYAYLEAKNELVLIQSDSKNKNFIYSSNTFSVNPLLYTMLFNKSMIIKEQNSNSFTKYNEYLDIIDSFQIPIDDNRLLFCVINKNKMILFNKSNYKFYFYDINARQIYKRIEREKQKYFYIDDPKELIYTNNSILLIDRNLLHYFDTFGIFIQTFEFSIPIKNYIEYKNYKIMLFETGDLKINGISVYKGVDNINISNDLLYILMNNILYKYEL